MESRKTLINQGFFGYRGSFPLDRSDGLRGEIVEDAVDAFYLVGDAIGDLMQQGIGDLFDGSGHGVHGVDGTDDGGPAHVALFIAVPDFTSVGVRDGKRYEGWPAIIRAVNTKDAMTATIEEIPYALLHHITYRITHEVEGINRVLLDLTPKPTGTIEWE